MNNILQVNNLKVYFPISRGFRDYLSKTKLWFKAVDGVDFCVDYKEILCLVGESGCGKTTIGRALLRLVDSVGGEIVFQNQNITRLHHKEELKELRRQVRMIFQDPYDSLNMRQNVFQTVAEPLEIFQAFESKELKNKYVYEALGNVGLTPPKDFVYRYPHQLSGGQRQRVSLATACTLQPCFIVADEPVSMLDMSVRMGILNLFLNLRDKFNMSFLFITHDLSVAWAIADRIAVMYAGKIVELGEANEVIKNPSHPYTKALISVIPVPDPTLRNRKKEILRGEITESREAKAKCKFASRCKDVQEICQSEPPPFKEIQKGHYALCHYPL